MKQKQPIRELQMDFPNPLRPRMIQRFSAGQERGEIWQRTLRVLQENRPACDEVWFSTGMGLPSLSFHREAADAMAAAARDLRAVGITASLQIQATVGHGDQVACRGDNRSKNWRGFTGANGIECRLVSCPRQLGFLNYFAEVARIHAQWHPGSIWIDDDLRPANHLPAAGHPGCYCPDCLAAFSHEEKNHYTRETLLDACRTDPQLELRWELFNARALAHVAVVIAQEFHRISPETRLGLQHCDDSAREEIFRAIRATTGRRPASRPGGGAYSDHEPYLFVEKAVLMSTTMAEQPGYELLDQICPEIESCPRVFASKTSQAHRVESLLYLTMGMDSLSYFMMDPLLEMPEWYGENLLAPLAAEAVDYNRYVDYNTGTLPGGVGVRMELWRKERASLGLPLIGVPMAAGSPYAACLIVTDEMIQSRSNDELQQILSGNILLDGRAVLALQTRKCSALIEGITAYRFEEFAREYCTDDPWNTDLAGSAHYAFGGERIRIDIPPEKQARIIGIYKGIDGVSYGPASLLLSRADGSRIAVLGHSGFDTRYISSNRVNFLYRVCDWVAHEKLPVLPQTPVQCLLVPRITADGNLRSVTVLNTVIGEQKPFTIRLRGVKKLIHSAEWLVPGKKTIELQFRQENEEAWIRLPAIAPWEIGWIRF